MTWFSLGPFYIQILYSFTWLLVCCWFWSHSCIVTVKLNNQTNISANQTQIFTQLNLYCMYNMCPEMCPRKWCGRKTAWKKLCCSSGICQMYSILFCKQCPMYARNISCPVLSWLPFCLHYDIFLGNVRIKSFGLAEWGVDGFCKFDFSSLD